MDLLSVAAFNVDLQISTGAERLPQETELTVFRLVQECLANIHRHSGSKTASIRLQLAGWLAEPRRQRRGKRNSSGKANRRFWTEDSE